MKAFYAYVRVSTSKQGERGVSLAEQRDAIERYALRNNLKISRWFEERHTAAIQGRPVFNGMLRDLSANRDAGVIIHKIDRSARNMTDWNEVTDLLDLGFDVHIAHDSLDLKSRSGRLAGDIQAVFAADYSRNLREEVKKGLYGRMKQGLLPRPAPLGYVDCGSGQPKTIDPATGPSVRELFELYATGRFSLRVLALEAQRIGLRARSGKGLRLTQLTEILHNPFYIGVIRVKKTQQSFPGIHQPLVSTAVFERVQQILHGKAPRQAVVHDFLFRRLLHCAHCNRSLIGERQKGRVYYRCQVPNCPTTTVREDVAEAHFLSLLKPLRFTAEHRKELLAAIDELKRSDETEQRERHGALQLRLANVNDRQRRLTDAYLEGALEKPDFEQRKTALLMERRELEDRIARGESDTNAAAVLTEFLELADRACLLYEKAVLSERRELIEIVTSNRVVDGRTPRFTLGPPFCELASECQQQSGGPSRITARTRAVARRLLKKVSFWLGSSKALDLQDRIENLLHPSSAPDSANRVHSASRHPLPRAA